MKGTLYIPENEYGIRPGYYSVNELAELLRHRSEEPEVVWFVADMLED